MSQPGNNSFDKILNFSVGYMKKLGIIVITIIVLIVNQGLKAESSADSSKIKSPFEIDTLLSNTSLIIDFSYRFKKIGSGEYCDLSSPQLIDREQKDSIIPQEGIHINYGELSFQGSMDPYFNISFDIIGTQDGFDLHELYAETTALPYSFKFKGGRFLSSFGGINKMHQHDLNFSDYPLMYYAFFGDQGLLENGFQLTWSIPVDFDLAIGTEISNGDNKYSFGRESFGDDSLEVKAAKAPNFYNFFLDSAIIRDAVEVNWGIATALGKNRYSNDLQSRLGNGLYGSVILVDVDLSVKYKFSRFNYILWSNEAIYKNFSGDYFEGTASGYVTDDIKKSQVGLYSELIFKLFSKCRFGVRGDYIISKTTYNKIKRDNPEKFSKIGGMLEYNPSEYTRIRLQYNYDKSMYDLNNKLSVNHEVALQFNLALGPHGSHGI